MDVRGIANLEILNCELNGDPQFCSIRNSQLIFN